MLLILGMKLAIKKEAITKRKAKRSETSQVSAEECGDQAARAVLSRSGPCKKAKGC